MGTKGAISGCSGLVLTGAVAPALRGRAEGRACCCLGGGQQLVWLRWGGLNGCSRTDRAGKS